MNYQFIIIPFLLLSFCFAENGRRWEQTGEYLGEMQFVLTGADQSVVTLGSDRDGKLVFTRIDKDGNLLAKKHIAAPGDFSFDGTLSAPAMDQNGHIYQLVKSPKKALLLASLDLEGNILGMVNLNESYPLAYRCWISSLHVLDGRLYMVGAQKRQLWIASASLDDIACLRVETSFSFGQNDMATDVSISKEGSLLIALQSGFFGRYGEGTGEVALAEFLPESKQCMLRYKAAGRTPALCQTRKGYAFAFDTETSALDQRILVHELDKRFQLLHSSNVSETSMRTSLPKISSAPKGGLYLIGMNNEQPELIHLHKGETSQQELPGAWPGMAIHDWTGSHLLYRVRVNPHATSPRNVFKEQLVALNLH